MYSSCTSHKGLNYFRRLCSCIALRPHSCTSAIGSWNSLVGKGVVFRPIVCFIFKVGTRFICAEESSAPKSHKVPGSWSKQLHGGLTKWEIEKMLAGCWTHGLAATTIAYLSTKQNHFGARKPFLQYPPHPTTMRVYLCGFPYFEWNFQEAKRNQLIYNIHCISRTFPRNP